MKQTTNNNNTTTPPPPPTPTTTPTTPTTTTKQMTQLSQFLTGWLLHDLLQVLQVLQGRSPSQQEAPPGGRFGIATNEPRSSSSSKWLIGEV